MTDTTDRAFEEIAREYLAIPTLQAQHSDGLDFHDIAVWCLRDALEAAYRLGQTDAGA